MTPCRASALSEGAAGKIRGGDRLPWVDGPVGGNFAALASLDWQIHVYGKAETALREAAARHGIALHEFAPSEAAIRVRLEEDALYLVRPDGHVGLAQPDQDVVPLERYVTRLGIAGRDA